MKVVIGLVGKIASGKGVVSDYLGREYGAKVYRFSDVLRDVLQKLGKPDTRENLQALGLHLRQVFGESVLADVLKGEIEQDKSSLIVVDGVRYWNEVEMVRSFKKHLLVSVITPLEVRYQRALDRATRGEKTMSFEEFRRNELNPTEKTIDEIAAHADIKIENLGTKEALIKTLDTVLKDRIEKKTA
ncbi:MAG: AAA family ATPase [Candidatus Altiarchaeota archaeon]